MDSVSENYIMWSAAEIAARDGVSKQAVSKSVQSIIAMNPNVPTEQDTRGRITKISLAHYDHYRERFMNPAKMATPILKQTDADSFEEARRLNEWMKLQREKVRHEEECLQLMRSDKVNDAITLAKREIAIIIDRLPNYADELAKIVAKEGVHGVRVALRKITFDLCNSIADRLEQMASEAPEFDPLIEGSDINEVLKARHANYIEA